MKLLKSLFLMLMAIVLAVGCSTEKEEKKTESKQSTEANTKKEDKKEEKKADGKLKGFFWEAKGEKGTVYLFGTMHIGNEKFYPLRDEIETAFKKSDALVTEIDMTKIDQQKYASQMVYPNGETIEKDLSPEALAHLKKRLEEAGISYEQMKVYKPSAITSLFVNVAGVKAGFDPQYGLDMYFTNQAIKNKKETLELETIEDQLTLLNGGTEQERNDGMLAIPELDKQVEQLKKMEKTVIDGDEKALQDILMKDIPKSQYKPMVADRNVNMTKKIEEFLKQDKTYFVAVGAAHVNGEDGIVELLKKKGYTLKRL